MASRWESPALVAWQQQQALQRHRRAIRNAVPRIESRSAFPPPQRRQPQVRGVSAMDRWEIDHENTRLRNVVRNQTHRNPSRRALTQSPPKSPTHSALTKNSSGPSSPSPLGRREMLNFVCAELMNELREFARF
eukprot:GEMP01087146.1.p1 GENE.GEMP01087146.1~~GEMP01087146.1.p1  ORF type:complete len:134 (+),score=39.00 GEMP01087146.1:117-518(+)